MEAEYRAIGEQKVKSPILLRQFLLCLASCLFYFMLGLGLGSPTVAVPQLRKRANSTEAVSEAMASWIASINGFSAIPSVFIFVIMSHYIGRKKIWIFTSVSTFVAFTIFYISKTAMDIFVSEFLLGVPAAIQLTISPMIMTECASPRYRGLIFAIKTTTASWGIWCANAIGAYYSYNNIGIVGMLCSILNFIIVTFLIPETPFWLASKGRYDECAKAHRWLKGVNEDAERELDALIKCRKDRELKKYTSLLGHIKKKITAMCQPRFYKPVSLAILVMFMLNASGKVVYYVYAFEILKKITKVQSTARNAMLTLDGFSVLGMYMGCGLVKIFNRRKLLLSFSTIAAILTFILSLYLYLVKLDYLTQSNYVTIGILVLYSLSTCCGPVLLASAICSELFPLRSRSTAIILIAMFKCVFLGTLLKFSPSLFEKFDTHGTFLFYGILFSVCIILVYKLLPETKDKTLNEIASLFE